MRFKILLLVFYSLFFIPGDVFAARTYIAPTSFTRRPRAPEIYANQGASIKKGDYYVTILPGTVPFDAYVSIGCNSLGNPIHISLFWQVSPVCELKIRSFHNDADYLLPLKKSVISVKYDPDILVITNIIRFPESVMKLVHSTDGGTSWTMERTSTVDVENKTVAAIDYVNGGYMLMSGFAPPKVFYNYHEVKGSYVSSDEAVAAIAKNELKQAPLRTRIVFSIDRIFRQILQFVGYY